MLSHLREELRLVQPDKRSEMPNYVTDSARASAILSVPHEKHAVAKELHVEGKTSPDSDFVAVFAFLCLACKSLE